MNAKQAKKIRQIAKRDQKAFSADLVREVKALPFRGRLKFAWRMLWL